MTPPPESDLPPDPELDSRLPQHEFDSQFCATEKYQKLSCVHGHTLARRVCTEGFDIGSVVIRPQTVKSLCISVIPGSVMLTHTVLEDL